VNYQILIDKEEGILRKTLLSSLEGNSEMNRNITPNKAGERKIFYYALHVFGVLHILTLGNYLLLGALSVTIVA
jgi:hypothetical protein